MTMNIVALGLIALSIGLPLYAIKRFFTGGKKK